MADERNYSKREIDQIIKGLVDGLQEHRRQLLDHMTSFEAETGATLMRIEKQTTTTNGRVSKLENWRNYITGGVAVLCFLVTALLAVLGVIAASGHL